MTKVFVNAEATQRKVNKKHVVEMIIAKFIFVCRRKIDLPRSIQFFCRFFSIEIFTALAIQFISCTKSPFVPYVFNVKSICLYHRLLFHEFEPKKVKL